MDIGHLASERKRQMDGMARTRKCQASWGGWGGAGQSQASEGALPEPCSRPLTCGNVPFQVVRGTTVRTQHVSHTVLRRPMTCKNDSGRRGNGGLHTNGLGSVYACDAAVV